MLRSRLMYLLCGAPVAIAAAGAIAWAAAPNDEVAFSVSIDSVAGAGTLTLPDGTKTGAPISPGLYLVSTADNVLFEPGKPAGSSGLESLAEDGNAAALIEHLNSSDDPAGAVPFLHNESFTVTAQPGDRLHFAVMFVQSNDLFYAPGPSGIALFDVDGNPISGDQTGAVMLWDAGTEVNQAPGAGSEQAPRQGMPNKGQAENGAVELVNDGFAYPATSDVIQVTITPQSQS